MNSFNNIFFFLPIIFIIFFAVRFILLWYWKIDRIEELLEEIAENTRTKTDHRHQASTSSALPEDKGSDRT